jgi:hypothetical protein
MNNWKKALVVSTTALALTGMVSQMGPAPAFADSVNAECFEVDNPQWAEFRAEADARVTRGELTRELADAYKCDPRKAQEDLVRAIERELAAETQEVLSLPASLNYVEVADTSVSPADGPGAEGTAAAAKPKKKCVEGYVLTHKLGGGTLTARQTLNWCYDGKKVSDWSGECSGSVNKWGKVLLWSFDGCTQNDWIPYKLGKYTPGGIHHKTKIRFTNKQWQVPDVETKLEQWGHNNGTIDQMVDGKLLHK